MKVLHVVTLGPFDGLGIPGPFNVAIQECASLAGDGSVVEVLTTHRAGSRRRYCLPRGVPVSSLRRSQVGSWLASAFSLRLVISVLRRRKQFDAFHFHASRDGNFLVLLILRFSLKGVVVCQTHGQIEARTKAHLFFDRAVTAQLLNKSDRVLALQNVERLRLIHAGVRCDRISILGNRGHIVNPYLGRAWPEGLFTIAFVAHLRARKRVDIALAVSKSLNRLGVEHRLVVAGPDGGDGELVSSAVRSGGAVEYVGTLDADGVGELLSRSHAFLFTADDEPFGMSLVESLGRGTPAVCGPGIHAADGLGIGEGIVRVGYQCEDAYAAALKQIFEDRSAWVTLSSCASAFASRRLNAANYAEELRLEYGR